MTITFTFSYSFHFCFHQTLILFLIEIQVPSVLNQENICRSEIPWDSRGVDKSNPEHADYLQNTVETFKSEVIMLINANLGKRRKHHTDTGKIILYNLHTGLFLLKMNFYIMLQLHKL